MFRKWWLLITVYPVFRSTLKTAIFPHFLSWSAWTIRKPFSAVLVLQYIADHQMNMFEDFIGYQSSTVLDEPEREAGTTSIPIPQREESENIPLPDLPGQLENVQQSGNEIAKRGMPT